MRDEYDQEKDHPPCCGPAFPWGVFLLYEIQRVPDLYGSTGGFG